MIPLALVTGFLGSGKTTLLRRLVERNRARRVAYLVNEFSHVDVDGRRLAETADNVHILPGGSIFCTCLVHEFIGALDHIPKIMEDRVDGVVIEASGVASPAVISQLLHDTRLDQVYVLHAVVSVVDPGTFPVLLQSLPNIAAQVAASTLVLVNKCDLHDEATVVAAETQARILNGAARILRTTHCDIDEDILEPARACPACSGTLAPCRDPNYAQFSLALARPIDLARFKEAVRALDPQLYRMKGHVPTTAGLVYMDYAAGQFSSAPAARADTPPDLVFVANGHAHEKVDALIAALRRGVYDWTTAQT